MPMINSIKFKFLKDNALIWFMHNRIYPYFNSSLRPCKYNPQKVSPKSKSEVLETLCDIKVAFICDEMTFRSFENDCQAVFLTPSNWLKTLNEFDPDLLFCESAWSGIEDYKGCWRGRIYKNKKLCFENRKDLLNIIDYCNRANIKTVFWNKEDPTYFNSNKYNFVDTALHFDYIFTTSKECVPLYKKEGHNNVNVLMFGFNPKLFNPENSLPKQNIAVFAGSWFSDHPHRCRDMQKIFNMVINKGMDLTIYNRNSDSRDPKLIFPEAYKTYIKNKIQISHLQDFIKHSRFTININTVKNSETMFARRVFELMACNTLVISNESKGMRRIFEDKVWFVDEDFEVSKEEDIRNENLRYVFLNHTYRHRLEYMANIANIFYKPLNKNVLFIYLENPLEYEKCEKHFNIIDYPNKSAVILDNNNFFSINDAKQIANGKINFYDYQFVYITKYVYDYKPNIDIMIAHFSYVESTCGIYEGNNKYQYTKNCANINVLFKIELLDILIKDINQPLNKYCI